MPASNHSLLGTVQAIQYTGSNLSDVLSVLGPGWHAYSDSASQNVTFYQPGYEQLQLGGFVTHPTDWLVSQPAYNNTTPALSGGFSVVPNSQFTQQYG